MGRILWLAIIVLVGGCAVPEAPPLAPLVFPPPPEEPRFVFERTVLGSADLKKRDSAARWRAVLTGEVETTDRFGKPFDVAVCQGKVFVSDTVRRIVMMFDAPNRQFSEIGTTEPGFLRKPLGLATDADCDLYVADGTLGRVYIYDQSGQFLRAIGGADTFERLSHVAVDPEGNRVFAVDTGGVESPNHRIRVFDGQSGKHLYDIGTRGEEPGQFNLPRDLELGPDGLLYLVDGGNFRVQVLSQDGSLVRTFGSIGRQFGQFSRPKGVAIDPEGNIYVSDAAFGNFQIFDAEGKLLMFIGNRSEKFERAAYMLPAGIDVDEDGRVYMVDQFFRKFDVFRPAELAEGEGFLGAWNLP